MGLWAFVVAFTWLPIFGYWLSFSNKLKTQVSVRLVEVVSNGNSPNGWNPRTQDLHAFLNARTCGIFFNSTWLRCYLMRMLEKVLVRPEGMQKVNEPLFNMKRNNVSFLNGLVAVIHF